MFNIEDLQKHAIGHKYKQSTNKIAENAESLEGTKKRAPVKSKGKHLCQSGKMQPKEEGIGETRRKHLCQSQKCALETRKVQRFEQIVKVGGH